MKDFIKKIFEKKSISLEELNYFISEYCKLMGIDDLKPQELVGIANLVQTGHFNLFYACKTAANILKIDLTILHDRNGEIIKVYIV